MSIDSGVAVTGPDELVIGGLVFDSTTSSMVSGSTLFDAPPNGGTVLLPGLSGLLDAEIIANSNGAQAFVTLISGGATTATLVASGGRLTAEAGGSALATTVAAGGVEFVFSGGFASGTHVEAGGEEAVSSGGLAVGTTISSGGVQFLGASPGSGGIKEGGVDLTVPRGGMVAGVTVSGAVASGAVVLSSGAQIVAIGGDAVGTVVSSGGGQVVVVGGSATGTVLISGGQEVTSGGVAIGTMVRSGGVAIALSGAVSSDATVMSGGVDIVSSGADGSGTVVDAGGLVLLDASSSLDWSATGQNIVDGVTIDAGALVTLAVDSGVRVSSFVLSGTNTFMGVSSGAFADDTVVSSGGVLVIASGEIANVSGTVLESGGILNFQGIVGTSASWNHDELFVTLSGGGTIDLSLPGNFANVTWHVASDTTSIGGTDVSIGSGSSTGSGSNSGSSPGAPILSAPATKSMVIGAATKISGVSLSEPGAPTTESFTVTLTDSGGALSATGKGVSGTNSTRLVISGTLAQVNADLKTLADKETVTPTDSITITALDSSGHAATPMPIAITVKPDAPVISAPPSAVIGVKQPGAVAKLTLAETGAFSGEMFTLTLTDKSGDLSAAGAVGNGSTRLTITGSLAAVNGTLATLQDQASTIAADTVTVAAADSVGDAATVKKVAIKVNGAPTVTVPATAKTIAGSASKIAGISVKETGTTTGETFTVTVTDATGMLSASAASAAGVSGSGTTRLTITGALAAVNGALAKLTDDESPGTSDSITVTALDGFGNETTGKLLPVTITERTVAPVHGIVDPTARVPISTTSLLGTGGAGTSFRQGAAAPSLATAGLPAAALLPGAAGPSALTWLAGHGQAAATPEPARWAAPAAAVDPLMHHLLIPLSH